MSCKLAREGVNWCLVHCVCDGVRLLKIRESSVIHSLCRRVKSGSWIGDPVEESCSEESDLNSSTFDPFCSQVRELQESSEFYEFH